MGKAINILLVEDSENDAFLLLRELKREGYEPNCAIVKTEKDMQREMQKENWDIVITDHNMPSFDSRDALRIVKSANRDIPVIIVSGSIGEDIAVEAMKSGAHDYIMKNNLARLVPAIERELNEAKTRSAHRKAEETIRHMAFHDALTNLVNRHEFERRINLALERAKSEANKCALLYIDLDQFKIINDTCGHIAGDELLRQLSVELKQRMRDNDTLARLGGDEFGALLEGCPRNRAYKIAESLCQAVRNYRFIWQGKPFSIGASIGMVMIDEHVQSAMDLLRAADMACYTAKDMGRDRIYVFESGDEEISRRRGEMQWVSRINQALDENRLTLFSQAITPLGTNGYAAHMELLLRMRDVNGDIIPPGAFIPAAERYNLMGTIDRWVINRAFEHIRDVNNVSANGTLQTAYINLSGSSLGDERLYDYIKKQMEHYRVAPGQIGFEITETAAIGNLRAAIEFIAGIRKLGCSFALDDFGSGLCSFSYLKSIPVDCLKIDGSFVRNMKDNDMDRAIVEAINQVGHVAGLRTIAEYVEDKSLLNDLRAIGVDYAQGFGIEHPKPLSVN